MNNIRLRQVEVPGAFEHAQTFVRCAGTTHDPKTGTEDKPMFIRSHAFNCYSVPTRFVTLALVVLTGCEVIHGSGHVITEKRRVDDFDQLVVEGEGEVRFTQSDTERLVIEAEDNLVDELVTSVHGDTLVIATRSGVILDPTKPILFHLEGPDLRRIKVEGSGEFATDELVAENLGVEISGSGELRIDDLEAQTLSVDISGSGDVRLAGKVESQDVEISGSGEYRCRNLESEDANVDVSGSGEVEVFVTDTLNVEISGSGDVGVRGNPETNVDISGSGDIGSIN